MKLIGNIIGKSLRGGLALICLTLMFTTPGLGIELTSQFFSTDPTAQTVMDGTPYKMSDPAWLLSASNQNKEIFAYKLFSGLLMLGYQTEIAINGISAQIPHLLALYAFQNTNGLPKSDYVTSDCLALLDQQLKDREQVLAGAARDFQLYDHMQPLHPNAIAKDALAAMYTIPMQALPKSLRMSKYEEVQCINGQCNGFIQGPDGGDLPWPIDMNIDYRFVGAYFDRLKSTSRLPSAAVHVQTVLHEYAHYLDGFYQVYANNPLLNTFKLIDTTGFYAIGYDLNSGHNGCYMPKSSNLQDWISKYAAQLPGYGNCTNGSAVLDEDWAESFSMYVASGRDFRAAAAQSTYIAQKYDWIKEHVFSGLEYDTDLVRDTESGCNDVYLYGATGVPGYAHCNNNYIWDFTLHPLQSSINTRPTAPVEGSFMAETNVNLSTVAISNNVKVSGINWPSPIAISGGEYAINGSTFTAGAGTVENGDLVTMRQTSAATFSTRTDSVLTIGGVNTTYSVTSRAPFQVTISGTPPMTALTSTPYTFVPAATNAASFSLGGTIPPGLQFNTSSGSLSGTPTTAGSYGPIIISAFNGALSAALPPFTIDVGAPVGTFSATGSLTIGRSQPTATLLSTGNVLVAGGYDDFNPLANVELFDPTSGSWSQAAPMLTAHADHTATLLTNGTVLVVGGSDANFNPQTSTDVYDPVANSWTAAAPLHSARSNHSATLLPNGKLLVIGGNANGVNSTGAELYDPATNSWQTIAAMQVGRSYHQATLLANGQVLVTGGYDANWEPTALSEQYDPIQDTWTDATPMALARANHTASLLADGSVLVVGGFDSNYATLASVERYAPTGNTWSSATALSLSRAWHSATMLADGKLLVAGGQGGAGYLATAEAYDATSNTWLPTGPMTSVQTSHSATLLTTGQVLLAGGSTDSVYAATRAQLFTSAMVPDFIISFQSDGMGSLSGVPSQRVITGGNTSSMTAVPAAGYRFVNWTGSGSFIPTTANPLSIANVAENLSITANFAPLPVNAACGGDHGRTFSTTPTDLCASGNASGVSGTGPWSWTCTGVGGGKDAGCNANITTWTVKISVSGSGAGTVSSQPAGIACDNGLNQGCSASFANAVTVTIQAAPPDAKSAFQGWGGDCTGNGSCTLSVTGNRNVSAIFISTTRVRVTGGAVTDHLTLQDAYDNATSGSSLLSQAGPFTEQFQLNRNINIKLYGGQDAGYQGANGYTTIIGSLTITQGSLEVDKLILQ